MVRIQTLHGSHDAPARGQFVGVSLVPTSRVEVNPLVPGGHKPGHALLGRHCSHWLARVVVGVAGRGGHLGLGMLAQLALAVDVLVGVAGGGELGQLGQGVASLVALDHTRVGVDH